MVIAAIIVGIILLFFTFLISLISDKKICKFDDGVTLGVVISILVFIETTLIVCIIDDPNPTAMDVYQGKTTLEITYRDTIPVDSIVVFKDEFKK